MSTLINCAECGEEIAFGDAYTSRMIHTGPGIGYGVCKHCYGKEWEAMKEQSNDL
jgi:hypothetical protein